MLQIDQLRLELNLAGGPRALLEDISFEVDAGRSIGLVGESGSGKSMTLRSILRIPPEGARVTGRILFEGRDVLTMGGRELREFRSREVAMIAQNPHGVLNPVLTIEQFMLEGLLGGRRITRDAALKLARELLDEVGIRQVDRVMGSYPHQLSGGMLQRVVIAAAIAGEPKLLLADEPTTALDVTTQAEVVAMLDELRVDRGLAMVFVTHDLDLAAAVCDTLVVMKDGRIVETGTPEQLYEAAADPYTRRLMESRPMHIEFLEDEPEGGDHEEA